MECNRCGEEMVNMGDSADGYEVFECPACDHVILLTTPEMDDLNEG